MRPISLCLLLAPLTAAAVDIPVTRKDDPLPDGCSPSDCSLREAVLLSNGSPGADRILLPASASPYQLTRAGAEDVGLTGDLDVAGELEVAGQGEAPVVIVQTSFDRVMELHGEGAPTTLRNVQMQGGKAVTLGGAVHATTARLAVIDSVFVSNVATSGGGAISTQGPKVPGERVTITRSRFEGNRAPQGGAVYMSPNITHLSNMVIEESQFLGNEATQAGGAVSVSASLQGGSLAIYRSLFEDNAVTSTSGVGGGVDVGNVSIMTRIVDSDFIGNRADGFTGRGGGVANAAVITASRFEGNVAARGGALYNILIDIADSWFCDNEALIDGGALYTRGAKVQRSTFCRNSAAGGGGAIKSWNSAGGRVTIERSTFDANRAPSGGAISMEDGELRVRQTTLASVDSPAAGSVGTLLRYDGPDDAADGSLVEFTGNLLRGNCSFASGAGAVNAAHYNANSGGDTCGLTQPGASFSNNITYVQLGSIPLLALANNGGPTPTRAPSAASNHPALDRVPLAACIDPDQRHYTSSDDACDAGAVETDGAPLPEGIFGNGFE